MSLHMHLASLLIQPCSLYNSALPYGITFYQVMGKCSATYHCDLSRTHTPPLTTSLLPSLPLSLPLHLTSPLISPLFPSLPPPTSTMCDDDESILRHRSGKLPPHARTVGRRQQ
jgi:hypothetical protein